MEGPTAPKHPRLSSIQHDSDLGRTPGQPTSHYSSSTNIAEAKANLKTILATRVSCNDPNIIDVLIKPGEVGAEFVQIPFKRPNFLTTVRNQTVQLELERNMYKPLVRRTLRILMV